MSLCYKCEQDIDEEEDYAECDNCDCLFHLKCANVFKKDVNARRTSKCLRLFCPDCFEEKSNGTFDKLKEIAKIMYKLDLFNQEQIVKQQKDNDVISS